MNTETSAEYERAFATSDPAYDLALRGRRADDRHLLPAIVSRPQALPAQRQLPVRCRGRSFRRLPRLPALPSRRCGAGDAPQHRDPGREAPRRRHRRRDRPVRLRRAADDRRPARRGAAPDRANGRGHERAARRAGATAGRVLRRRAPRVRPCRSTSRAARSSSGCWGELRRIPYGDDDQLPRAGRARRGGARFRAVGRANGANRVAILVPCHRVIATGGGLGGYGGGLDAKRRLLDLEAAVAS